MPERTKWQFKLRTLLAVIVVLSCVLATTVFVYDRYVRQPRAMFLAAERGDADAIRRLLDRGVSIPEKDSFNRTPLMFAAMNGHLEATKVLVAAGAPIDEPCMFGMTPLIFATSAGKLEVVEYLVAQGADTTLVTDGGHSIMYWAKGSRNPDVVDFLEGLPDPAN